MSILNTVTDKGKAFWGRISNTQRILFAVLSAALIAAFFLLVVWINKPNYQVLYSNLSPQDANQVVKTLQTDKVPYQLENGGTTVMVPEDKVYDLRLRIAGEGGLTGQGVGFEIFDEVKVGLTDFAQKINYQRALQGELSRTITEFPSIESARVHLVMPAKSLFIEEQRKPSASVVLKMKGAKQMETKDVQAIVNLLIMSVDGLDKSRVSVADTTGKVLYSPLDENAVEGLTTTQLDHKTRVQRMMEQRIEELLFPLAGGAGKVIAKVNAELDFSQKTIRRELYDPEKTVLRGEIRSEESQRGNSNLNGAVPEPNFRPDSVGANSFMETSRESRTSNFEINKEEQNIVAQSGEISRVTVAVLVDGTYTQDEQGNWVYTARTDAELERIRQLVAQAVGFSTDRGDAIEVTSVSFGTPEAPVTATLPELAFDYLTRLGKPILNALLAFLFLLLVVRPVIMVLIRPKVQGEAVEGLEGLPAGEERLALMEGGIEDLAAMDSLKQIEDIKIHAAQMAEQNMEQAISIIRSWLRNGERAKIGA